MKKQNLKVLKEYSIPFDLELPEEYFQDAQRVLNYHFLGDEECNHYNEEGKYVAKYPEKETQELKDAHHHVRMTHRTNQIVELLEDGCIRFKK